jgi:hypothetical protein
VARAVRGACETHDLGERVDLVLAGFAVSSAGNLLSGLVWSVAAAFTMQTIRGVGGGMGGGPNTIIQWLVPSAILGRVLGNLYGAIGAAAGLSTWLADSSFSSRHRA